MGEACFGGNELEHVMETVYIYPLATLRKGYARRLREARMEVARVWTLCRDLHLAARQAHTRWPTRDDLQQATKGLFALHSQTVQMVCQQFLANVDTARELRQTNSQDPLPLQGQTLLSPPLACSGRE